MPNLSREQLRKLYFDFTIYRDNQCGGRAGMSVTEFYEKNRKSY